MILWGRYGLIFLLILVCIYVRLIVYEKKLGGITMCKFYEEVKENARSVKALMALS